MPSTDTFYLKGLGVLMLHLLFGGNNMRLSGSARRLEMVIPAFVVARSEGIVSLAG